MDYEFGTTETTYCRVLGRQLMTVNQHILYHLPTEYDTINDKYLKDLDDGKDVDLEDLRADIRRKYNRLVDSGCIEKN